MRQFYIKNKLHASFLFWEHFSDITLKILWINKNISLILNKKKIEIKQYCRKISLVKLNNVNK